MAVGDAIVIFRQTGFTPAVGVEIVLTSLHNTGTGAYIGNSDNPVVNNCTTYSSNGATSMSAWKLFITNTNPYYSNQAAAGATGIQIK